MAPRKSRPPEPCAQVRILPGALRIKALTRKNYWSAPFLSSCQKTYGPPCRCPSRLTWLLPEHAYEIACDRPHETGSHGTCAGRGVHVDLISARKLTCTFLEQAQVVPEEPPSRMSSQLLWSAECPGFTTRGIRAQDSDCPSAVLIQKLADASVHESLTPVEAFRVPGHAHLDTVARPLSDLGGISTELALLERHALAPLRLGGRERAVLLQPENPQYTPHHDWVPASHPNDVKPGRPSPERAAPP